MSHSVNLSRPARLCGGRMPLELVVRKLARAGESSALADLLALAVPLSVRVWWTMHGTSLTVEVA